MRNLTLASTAAALLLAASPGWAQIVCTSCAGCTAALASPDVSVELGRDISWDGRGACVTIRGANANFDGLEHAIRSRVGGQGAGVRVEAAGVHVRNVHVLHAAEGIVVEGAERATLFHNSLQVRGTGVRLTRARGARVARGLILGGETGIAFGAVRDGQCAPGATVSSPEAVVQRTVIDGAGVGIAACDALPVLVENSVRRGGVGLVLGAPAPGPGLHAAAPWDPCVCGAELPGVRPGSTLFYTSGCAGCQVHEGWMPELRRGGVDVLSRDSNNTHLEAQQRFDRFARRCAPDLMDALGIPGCVPNYACAATGRATKERRGDRELNLATPVNSPSDLRAFAEGCRASAAQGYQPDARCVRAQLQRNEFCDNRVVDVRGAARFGAVGDACARVEGFRDAASRAGCDRPCGTAPPPPSLPPAREEQASMGEPPTPGAAPEPAQAPTAPSTTATAAPAGPPMPDPVEPARPLAPPPGADSPTSAPAPAQRIPREENGPFGYVLLALLVVGGLGAIVRARLGGGDHPRS